MDNELVNQFVLKIRLKMDPMVMIWVAQPNLANEPGKPY